MRARPALRDPSQASASESCTAIRTLPWDHIIDADLAAVPLSASEGSGAQDLASCEGAARGWFTGPSMRSSRPTDRQAQAVDGESKSLAQGVSGRIAPPARHTR